MNAPHTAGRTPPLVRYPLFLTGALLAHAMLIGLGAAPMLVAYGIAVVAALSVVLLERLDPERDDWRPCWSDIASDGACAAVVQAMDVALCRLHRACHDLPLLCRLHKAHRSPAILYLVNVARFHPLKKTLHFSRNSLPFPLPSVPPAVIATYRLVYSVRPFPQPSTLPPRYGWLNRVVGSAETHRWHHASEQELAHRNLDNSTIVWDPSYGPWRLPGPVGELGTTDRSYPKGFRAPMPAPFGRGRGAA